MRLALLAMAIAAMGPLIGQAQATATYTLVDQVYAYPDPFDPRGNGTLTFTLAISDAAVQRGTFNLQAIGGSQLQTFTGDTADLVRFDYLGGSLTPGNGRFINLMLSLTLTPGSASGSINLKGETSGFNISSNVGGVWSGSFGADNSRCGFGNGCSLVSARVASVPEPAPLAMFGLGAAALGMMRRRSLQS